MDNADSAAASDTGGLQHVLERAGWTPRQLARAVNAWLDARGRRKEAIHPTAPYQWVRRGFCPYGAIPEVTAEVLSQRLGERVTPEALWPHRRARRNRVARSAGEGLAGLWTPEATLGQLEDLVARGERGGGQQCAPASGLALVTPALDGLSPPAEPLRPAVTGDRVLPPLVDLITGHVAELRRLDDRAGGGLLSLRYVGSELRGVLDLVKFSTYSTDVGENLLLALADLAQLSGWMHFDACDYGGGQRYLLLALRAARAAAESAHGRRRQVAMESAANILGMLSYQAAHTNARTEAIRLAEAAAEQVRGASAATRARIAGRRATAHAAAGDIHAFRAAASQARELLEQAVRRNDGPAFLYYLNPHQLEAETGQALVGVAAHNPAQRQRLLGESVQLLAPLTSAGPRDDYQRSALLHGCYLAEAHLRRGEFEQAAGATRTVLTRLPGVQSRRCIGLLGQLRGRLAARTRNPWVADVLPELDDALYDT